MTNVWDTVVTGLHIRELKTKNVYYLVYRFQGVQRKVKIGDVSVLTLTEARTKAKNILARAQLGEDPRSELREGLTVSEVFKKCLKDHWSKERFQKSKWQYEVEGLFKRHIDPRFGKMRLTSITAEDVEEWHASLSKKPVTANRALSVFSKVFSFAQKRRFIPQWLNPCKLIDSHPEKSRHRFATLSEIQTIGKILEREAKDHPREVLFIYLLMFTGARPSSIERARYSDIKLTKVSLKPVGILKMEGKTGAETIILPPKMMQILDKIPQSGTITGIKMPRLFWNKVRKEAGCEDLWVRDWRRTFATIGFSGGQDMSSISEVLNHKSTQTTKIYAKLMDDSRIKSSLQISDQMDRILKSSR
ncbi:DUF4102 domain-containing protein [Candidatus Dojkabacteria bacterium]|uniref:DUF4102 domain-containing protein n=1 Tax=Candidatus Dojkabacteria bacterium TaxID=2099670 RepID=A0A5C7J842_9BACT|nr:MAG: DUF4102 domain-containing protein [Candidatus Dojkabacteria bacterium]